MSLAVFCALPELPISPPGYMPSEDVFLILLSAHWPAWADGGKESDLCRDVCQWLQQTACDCASLSLSGPA